MAKIKQSIDVEVQIASRVTGDLKRFKELVKQRGRESGDRGGEIPRPPAANPAGGPR
jgi:hypothetical protein